VVYRQSVHRGAKPLEAHGQRFVFAAEPVAKCSKDTFDLPQLTLVFKPKCMVVVVVQLGQRLYLKYILVNIKISKDS
jgi:hypothetical protein